MSPRAATIDDLYALGYARTFAGHWLRPDGLSVAAEEVALSEAAAALGLLHPTESNREAAA